MDWQRPAAGASAAGSLVEAYSHSATEPRSAAGEEVLVDDPSVFVEVGFEGDRQRDRRVKEMDPTDHRV